METRFTPVSLSGHLTRQAAISLAVQRNIFVQTMSLQVQGEPRAAGALRKTPSRQFRPLRRRSRRSGGQAKSISDFETWTKNTSCQNINHPALCSYHPKMFLLLVQEFVVLLGGGWGVGGSQAPALSYSLLF